MAQVAFHNSYKLKKGVSTAEFVRVVEQLNREYISKQRGYLSFELLVDGETWADITKFETKEDAETFARCGTPNAFAQKFYSFIHQSKQLQLSPIHH
ncbi:antibiotic biosynthesis monooxygenase family protein [Enterococcus casseliflavus]|uniref:antibiotic biosynthesis monooxygenase family protein n=1 Tax=Enterococcus casseliflavus TaxID=37734 RepID=UPI001F503375|nr:hypothetical protein [Enterococcus casseliflavus]